MNKEKAMTIYNIVSNYYAAENKLHELDIEYEQYNKILAFFSFKDKFPPDVSFIKKDGGKTYVHLINHYDTGWNGKEFEFEFLPLNDYVNYSKVDTKALVNYAHKYISEKCHSLMELKLFQEKEVKKFETIINEL